VKFEDLGDERLTDRSTRGGILDHVRAEHPVDDISDGFVTLDHEWRIVYLNRAADEMLRPLGRTPDTLIGKNIWTELPELRGSELDTECRRAVAEQVTLTVQTFYPPLKAWLEGRAYPSSAVLSVYFRAITASELAERSDRERQRREAQAASQAKDDFLAVLSHELRTPLQAMLGWAHMLASGKLDEATVRRAAETIERNTRLQTQLIDDLLDVSRIVAGKLQLDERAVDLLPVIDAAIEGVRPTATAKGLHVETELDPSAGPVWGDPGRLQQVVWNLVSNAVKFTPPAGRVEIRLARVTEQARLTVSDTGRGIEQELLPHVFDRFRQADSSSRRRHGGLGLGLAIARQLVEMHHGTIGVASEGEGRGATFTVTLPILAMPSPTVWRQRTGTARRRRTPELTGLQGLRVLAVDDDTETRQLLDAVLTRAGAGVRTASSSAEALTILDSWLPNVLVADLAMPDEDGLALIRRLRARPADQGGRMPALALSAFARDEDQDRALEAGYQRHLAKPAEPAHLVEVLAKLAGR
jgi:signal transduction histidine kinase